MCRALPRPPTHNTDLQHNFFDGRIAPLHSMTQLLYLNLASNKLTGSLDAVTDLVRLE